MKQPPVFIDWNFPNHAYRLHKSIYGLLQAPHTWLDGFSDALLEIGFIRSQCDTSMFLHRASHGLTILLLCVDDIIVTDPSYSFINKLLPYLSSKFEIKDLGPLHYFLGIEVYGDPNGINTCQTKYVLDLLQKANMLDAKPNSSPVASGAKFSKDDGDPLQDVTYYRSIVGALQCLTTTRPDIAYAVIQVCQLMHKPCQSHLMAQQSESFAM